MYITIKQLFLDLSIEVTNNKFSNRLHNKGDTFQNHIHQLPYLVVTYSTQYFMHLLVLKFLDLKNLFYMLMIF